MQREENKINVNIYMTMAKSIEWDRSNREEGQDGFKKFFLNHS